MNIWIIQAGEPLPTDESSMRLLRSGMLATTLASEHHVTWWASRFNHYRKSMRSGSDDRSMNDGRLRIRLIDSMGYAKNISLRRYLDHKQLARNFRKAIQSESKPDLIYSALPINDLCDVAVQYARVNDIPIAIDIRDMWPDQIVEEMPAIARPFVRAMLSYDHHQTHRLLRDATAITGHAPFFVDWAVSKSGRPRTAHDRHFFFGYPDSPPDESKNDEVRASWQSHGVSFDDDTPIICFFGNFGEHRANDLDTVVEAARRLHEQGVSARFVLCGDGIKRSRHVRIATENVILPGWVDPGMIQMLMRHSVFGLLPYDITIDYANSVPNKAVEYLSCGLPILTCLTTGYFHDMLLANECGAFYTARKPEELADRVIRLLSDVASARAMGARAKELYDSTFQADKCTGRMINYLVGLANGSNA